MSLPPDPATWQAWEAALAGSSPEETLAWADRTFPGRLVFASSLGAEDQVLTDMLTQVAPRVPIFTLDTGRLFPETYTLLEETERRYGVSIRVAFPDAREVEAMVGEHGINLFKRSVELRKRCCAVRKLRPLARFLSVPPLTRGGRGDSCAAWIVGLRREQSITRQAQARLEWDETHGLVKLSPLADWSETQVWDYIRDHHVPCNPLHDQGYPSIGCACCTRAVQPGEDLRSGRWWWEQPEHRECGLHAPSAGAQRAAPRPGGS